MLNAQSVLDTTKVVTGKDGQIFLTLSDGTQIFLANVDTAQLQLNVKTIDYQPVGSAVEFAIVTGWSFSLSLTEVVVRDDVMLTQLYEDMADGHMPTWDFQTKITRSTDGEEERQVCRNCVPSGAIDLFNLSPGEIIKRPWNFRVNSNPELLSYFAA